jgi:hypothetical protein
MGKPMNFKAISSVQVIKAKVAKIDSHEWAWSQLVLARTQMLL